MGRLRAGALWSLFTVMAVLSGLGAVAVVRTALAGSAPEPLTAAQVSSELGRLSAGPPTPAPTAASPSPTRSGGPGRPSASPSPSRPGSPTPHQSPSPAASPRPTKSGGSSAGGGSSQPTGSAGQTRVLTSRGGSVVASCSAGQAYLRSWSPAAGYAVDEVHRGPASTAEIKFRATGGREDEVKMDVTCRGGLPTASSVGDLERD